MMCGRVETDLAEQQPRFFRRRTDLRSGIGLEFIKAEFGERGADFCLRACPWACARYIQTHTGVCVTVHLVGLELRENSPRDTRRRFLRTPR